MRALECHLTLYGPIGLLESDNDDILLRGKMLPIVKATLNAPVVETTPIDVDHHGFLDFTACRYPDVQSEAVFAEFVGKLE